MWTQESLHELVLRQKAYFGSGETLPVAFRIEQLKKLKAAVVRYEEELENALAEDLGRSREEAYFCDIGTVILEINETLRGIRAWARSGTKWSGLCAFPSLITKVYRMPYGNTLIISPFNFPVLLSLGVLTASLAGGNTAVLKVSSKAPATEKVLSKLIGETFPSEYVAVVGGGHDVADYCLSERFDKIFYTGSPKVGVHVLECAAKNLTPVALELGGENGNFAIVRKDANLKDAARKIAFFKICNSGQICINVNQVAVAKEVAEPFLEELKLAFLTQIGNAPENPEYPKLITKAAFEKCESEAETYRDRIVYGGYGNAETCKYAPSVIYPVSLDEPIVNHELFCPLLPVVPFEDAEIDALLSSIEKREHGLALYLFTKDVKWAKRTMQRMQYGGGCINEVCLHLLVKGAPFGGVGHSGMGAYHGKYGFSEFTHNATVLIGKTHGNLPLREHPYTGRENAYKMKLMKRFER